MPVYTYHCENCGVTFDQRQSFSDDALKVCPECEAETLHKVYQPVGIVFKGKGFYATDHKSASGNKRHNDSKSESSGGESGGSDSAEKSSSTGNNSTASSEAPKEAKSHAPSAK